jgi:hypothetical protein
VANEKLQVGMTTIIIKDTWNNVFRSERHTDNEIVQEGNCQMYI